MTGTELGVFLFKWQDLIGSALGPFLGVVLSGIGVGIGWWLKGIAERKEAHRQIEIGTARSLNDMYVLREQITWFVARLRDLAREARAVTDPKVFFLVKINFPNPRQIYTDMDVSRFRVRSYYVHNKLLFVDAGNKHTNETAITLKNDYGDLLRQNELMMSLMAANPNPPAQRDQYAENLEIFAKALESYAMKGLSEGIKGMAQLKVYNNQLRGLLGFWNWWKTEGLSFKYFRTPAEMKKYTGNLESLKRIDSMIEENVQGMMTEAERRGDELFAEDRATATWR